MSLFDGLDAQTEPENIIRAPFPYSGGKSRSIKYILSHLPYRTKYCEPFGGSAAILLSRNKSLLEIYNDRFGGIVAFYRCIRDKIKLNALIERLALTINAREEFIFCKNWDVNDDIERAARWYYITNYSFNSLGRVWGRSLSGAGNLSGKLRNKLKLFPIIHNRFRNVQVENRDYLRCFDDYDSDDMVWYLDPPYVDADSGIYKCKIKHQELVDRIFRLKGFVALSGYSNPIYENRPWDNRHEWKVFNSSKNEEERGENTEVLWIKE